MQQDAGPMDARFVGPPEGYPAALPDGVESRIRYVKLPGRNTVRTEFRISARWNMADPTEHIQRAARTVAGHFRTRPNAVLAMSGRGTPTPSWYLVEIFQPCCQTLVSLLESKLAKSPSLASLLPGNQVAQSVRAQGSEADVSMSALHANGAWQQGVLAGLVAILDFAAGGSCLDQDGNILISPSHCRPCLSHGGG